MKASEISGRYLSPIKVFVVFALVFGIIFIFLTPPYQVSDEDNHFYRAYQLSELQLRGNKTQVGPGDTLPRRLLDTKNSFDYLAQQPTHKVDYDLVKAGLSRPLDSKDKVPIGFPNTVIYPPAPYVPSAIAIGILRHFEPPPLLLMYAARLCTFAAWFLLIYASIKITPVGKWAFCVFALMPMSLFTGASVSADAVTNGLSFLAVALFFRYAMTKDSLIRKDYLALFGVSAGLALCKPPYFLLAFLFLLLPIAKFKSKKRYLQFAGSLVLIILVMLVGWAFVTKGLYANYRITYDLANGQLIHAHQQAALIIHQPFEYIATLYNTYFTGQGDARAVGFIGMLGWLAFLPFWSVLLGYGLIVVSLGWLGGEEEKNLVPLARWRKLLIAAIGIAGILAFSTLAYLTYTPLGKSSIDGIQGRYFIPLSVLLVAFFATKLRPKTLQLRKLSFWTTVGLGVMLVSSIIVIIFRYYVHSVVSAG